MSKKYRQKQQEATDKVIQMQEIQSQVEKEAIKNKPSTGRKLRKSGRPRKDSNTNKSKPSKSNANVETVEIVDDDDVSVITDNGTRKKKGKKGKKKGKKSKKQIVVDLDLISDATTISEPDTLPKDDSMYNVDDESDLGSDDLGLYLYI